MDECQLLDEVLQRVARQFKAVKFVKIIATAAVENWPDRNLPTIFVYRGGELRTQLLGIKRLGGRGVTPGGKECGCCCAVVVVVVLFEANTRLLIEFALSFCYVMADVEWWLASHGIVETEMEEDPREAGKKGSVLLRGSGARRGYAEDEDGEDSD